MRLGGQVALALGVAACLGGLSGVTAGRAEDRQAQFRAVSDAVRVDVAVRQNGRPLSGLTAADFSLTDNGVPQRISDVSFEKGAIDVTIALDLSRSVSGNTLRQLRVGIDRLKGRLQPDDRVRLVSFNMRVRRLVDFDEPPARLDEALAAAGAGGATSLVDTLAVLLASPAPPDRRHLIIVFSDGEDTASITDDETLLAVARRTTPTVAFVRPTASSAIRGLTASQTGAPVIGSLFVAGTPAGVAGRGLAIPSLYQTVADETGGRVLQTSLDGLSSAFGRLLDDFRSSYVLFFSPAGVSRDGFHQLEVSVRRDRGLEVHARRGYVAD